MINKTILLGRVASEPNLKQTQSGVSVLSFTVAVERSYTKQGEEKQADFISCVAWKNTAEFISKYFSKGRMIAIEGNLRTRTYEDKNGSKHYVTEVYVDSVSFTGEAKQDGKSAVAKSATTANPVNIGNFDDFEEIISDDGVPF
jgi:single-strand DNA-binding protein